MGNCLWDCCKSTTFFSILIICVGAYCLLGAYVFSELEWKQPVAAPNITAVVQNVSSTYNISFQTSTEIVKRLEEALKQQLASEELEWTLLNSAIFCVTVMTTIGYGVMAPSTFNGRLVCIFYSIIGIPLCMLMLSCFGGLIANLSTSLITFIEHRLLKRRGRPKFLQIKNLLVCAIASAVVTASIFGPFKDSTGWSSMDCLYFLWISTSTIGFGDLYPSHKNLYVIDSWEKQLQGDFSGLADTWRDQLTGFGIMFYTIFSLSMVASILNGFVDLINECKELFCACCKRNVSTRMNVVHSESAENIHSPNDVSVMEMK